MTESIFCISVGVVCLVIGLLVGYIWGRRSGECSGFERGLRVRDRADSAALREYHSKFKRYQCSRKFLVRSQWDIENLELAATSHVKMMGQSLLDQLIENRVIRPFIVSKEQHGEGEIWNVCVSMYCATDPACMEYDSLPFIRSCWNS